MAPHITSAQDDKRLIMYFPKHLQAATLQPSGRYIEMLPLPAFRANEPYFSSYMEGLKACRAEGHFQNTDRWRTYGEENHLTQVFFYPDRGTIGSAAFLVPQGAFGTIECVWTRADIRRSGLASAVIQHLLLGAREAGLQTVYLYCLEPNYRFYKRLGFEAQHLEM